MYLIILGLAFGLVIGGFLQFNIPPEYTRYTAVAIIGILDSLFGAIRASVEKKFNAVVFHHRTCFQYGYSSSNYIFWRQAEPRPLPSNISSLYDQNIGQHWDHQNGDFIKIE